MPIPAPVPFDIAPALSQYQTGIQTRVGLQDRQREWEGQAEEAIMRAADLADTPEKWERFVTQIGSRFEGADLSQVTWENRDYYLSGNPQYRAQQERNRAAGAAASASAAAAATRQRRLSELVGGSAPAAGGVPAGAGGIPTLGTPRTGPPALSALGGAAAPAQQVSAEEAYIPGMETPMPPPPAPLAAGAGMPPLGVPTAAPTFNAQATSYLASIGFSPQGIAGLQRMTESDDPRQWAIAEEAISAQQQRSVAGPAAPDYGFTEVDGRLYRTDAAGGTATALTPAAAGNADPPENENLVGPDGKEHVMGYNRETGRYDIDYGLAPARSPLVDMTTATPFGETLGDELAKEFTDAREGAQLAADSLRSNAEANSLIQRGIITGFGADFLTGFGNFLGQIGINFAADAVANTQAYVASRGREVGNIIRLFGAGTGLSDADREYARAIAAGEIRMTEGAIRRILDINERASRSAIQTYNDMARRIEGAPGYAANPIAPYPLAIEMPGASPPAIRFEPGETYRYNPATGTIELVR